MACGELELAPATAPSPRTPPSLDALPDEALHRVLAHLLGVPPAGAASAYAPLALRGRSLERLQDAADLARASARARRMLRASVSALAIRWDDGVGAGVVGFFAPRLRELAVSRHVQAPRFIEALARCAPPLERLRLAGCPLDHAELAAAVRAVRGTLREFSLEYVNAAGARAGAGVTCAALAACPRLERLSLHGAADLPHASLARVLRDCRALRALSIGYLRHATMGPPSLDAIGACGALDTLALHDTRWAAAEDVVRACAALGRQLRCLSLDGVQGFTDVHLADVVESCPLLVGLTVRCDTPGLVTAAGITQAVRALAPNLLLLDVSGSVGVGDEEMPAILAAAPSLKELRIRNAIGCTNATMFEIAQTLAKSLRVLDIAGTSVSDEGLAALSVVSRLKALHIGTSAARRPLAFAQAAQGGALRPAVITNVGVEELLRGCGRSLRRFSCEDIQAALPPPFAVNAGGLQINILINANAGAAPANRYVLGGAGVFSSLKQHCSPKLEVVVMQKMQPPLHNRRDRSRMECRMYELEDAAPQCYCWIDREAPPLHPMTLEDLLADDGAE